MYGDLYRSNQTKLSDFGFDFKPEMEPVNAATGMMEAMIESAQFDMKLMEAMLTVDAYETKLRANGSVNESAIVALHEGAKEKVKNAILNAWEWLLDKVRQIKIAVANAFNKIFDQDKKLLEKYKKDLLANKDKLGRLVLEDEFKYWDQDDNGGVKLIASLDDMSLLSIDVAKEIAKKDAETPNFMLNKRQMYSVIFHARPESRIYKFMEGELSPQHVKQEFTVDKVIKDMDELKEALRRNQKVKDALIKTMTAMKKKCIEDLKKEENDAVVLAFNRVFSAYKQYVLMVIDLQDKGLKERIKFVRKALHLFVSKLNKGMNESFMDMYLDMREAEFDHIMESSYSNMLYILQEV